MTVDVDGGLSNSNCVGWATGLSTVVKYLTVKGSTSGIMLFGKNVCTMLLEKNSFQNPMFMILDKPGMGNVFTRRH